MRTNQDYNDFDDNDEYYNYSSAPQYPKISIGFCLVNEVGNEYTMGSDIIVYPGTEMDEMSTLFRQFNCFLRQCGYSRPNDYILPESLTEEEYEVVGNALWRYRDGKENQE